VQADVAETDRDLHEISGWVVMVGRRHPWKTLSGVVAVMTASYFLQHVPGVVLSVCKRTKEFPDMSKVQPFVLLSRFNTNHLPIGRMSEIV
jgi:hypothetical protein